MTRLEFLVQRLRHLTDTLSTLRERVREAVATELGQAVGQAVQDVLQTLASGRTNHLRPTAGSRSRSSTATAAWDDDSDRWDDESVAVRKPDATNSDKRHPNRCLAAVGTATRIWTWWRTQRGPAWMGLGLGLLAGAAAWTGGPLLTAGLSLAGATLDLLATGTPVSTILGL